MMALMTLAAGVSVPLTYYFVDHAVALAAYRSLNAWLGGTPEVHDLLGCLVVAIAAAGFAARFVPAGPAWFAQLRAAVILGGVVAPIAYATKAALKLLFGRIETRLWIANVAADGFHWLHFVPGFDGFPSGHMTVCLPLAAIGWRYYPRLAWLWLSSSLVLPGLLVGTAYHFVSDVIAGGYLGFVLYVGLTTPRALAFWRVPPADTGGR